MENLFLPCTSSPVQHFPYIIRELSTYCELNLVTVGECPPGSALALQVPGEAAQAFPSDALRYCPRPDLVIGHSPGGLPADGASTGVGRTGTPEVSVFASGHENVSTRFPQGPVLK